MLLLKKKSQTRLITICDIFSATSFMMRRAATGVRRFGTKRQKKNEALRDAFEKKRVEKIYEMPLPAEPAPKIATPEEFSVWSLPVFRLAKPYFNTPRFRPRETGMGHEYVVAAFVGFLSAYYIVLGPPTIGGAPTEKPIRYEGSEQE
jgi:hypothetical protein